MVRTSFAYRVMRFGIHVHVTVYAGPDEQHRARCGDLTMRTDEFADWSERVIGSGHTVLADDEEA